MGVTAEHVYRVHQGVLASVCREVEYFEVLLAFPEASTPTNHLRIETARLGGACDHYHLNARAVIALCKYAYIAHVLNLNDTMYSCEVTL